MEHITIKELDGGLVRLTPNKGYRLYNKMVQQYYSEAVVKENEIKKFEAVKVL